MGNSSDPSAIAEAKPIMVCRPRLKPSLLLIFKFEWMVGGVGKKVEGGEGEEGVGTEIGM